MSAAIHLKKSVGKPLCLNRATVIFVLLKISDFDINPRLGPKR